MNLSFSKLRLDFLSLIKICVISSVTNVARISEFAQIKFFSLKIFYRHFVISHIILGILFLNGRGRKDSGFYNFWVLSTLIFIQNELASKSVICFLILLILSPKILAFSTTLILVVILVSYPKYSWTSFLFLKHLKKSLLFHIIVLEIIILIT